jgi:penicillin V acylase-like amidase (Ntn superfamily)
MQADVVPIFKKVEGTLVIKHTPIKILNNSPKYNQFCHYFEFKLHPPQYVFI